MRSKIFHQKYHQQFSREIVSLIRVKCFILTISLIRPIEDVDGTRPGRSKPHRAKSPPWRFRVRGSCCRGMGTRLYWMDRDFLGSRKIVLRRNWKMPSPCLRTFKRTKFLMKNHCRSEDRVRKADCLAIFQAIGQNV